MQSASRASSASASWVAMTPTGSPPHSTPASWPALLSEWTQSPASSRSRVGDDGGHGVDADGPGRPLDHVVGHGRTVGDAGRYGVRRAGGTASPSVEHGLRVGRPHGTVRAPHRRGGGPVRRGSGTCSCPISSPPTRSPPRWTSSTGSRPRSMPSCRPSENGRFSIAETGALTVTPHAVTRSRGAARAEPAPPDPRASAPISSALTYASTGTRRSTRSRRSRDGCRGTRTTATPTSSRRPTSPAGSPSPTRRSRTGARRWPPVATGSARSAPLRRSTRPRVPHRRARRRVRGGARRRRGVLLVADPPPHRSEHHRSVRKA